jgi:diacylglycerol kinase
MRSVIKSFGYAIQGLQFSFKHELNFKIEIACGIVACTCAFLFGITRIEWFMLLINITVVLMAELFNTALEKMCNMIQKETHATIKIIKDVSAAAVTITALFAFITGLIIFTPYFLKLLSL